MSNSYDWRADVRARLENANLAPDDQADMVEEIGQHLEQQFAELAARIGSAAARERLLAQLREEEFDKATEGRRRLATPSRARVWSSSSLVRDIRQGARSFRRSPGTLVAGVAALALGIGLTATMFSIIYGLLIKGLPFDEPARIAIVKLVDPRQPGVDALVSLGDFAHYRAQQRSFERLAAYATTTVNVSGGDRADRVEAARVTTGVLETPRVRPALGRMFGDADLDPAAPATAVLGHALWRDRFAASPNVIGATLRVNGRPHTIIGVMPPNYEFPYNTRLWLPLQENVVAFAPGKGERVSLVGRLRPDVTYDNANAEFTGLTERLATIRPVADSTLRIAVLPFVRASINPRVYSLLYGMLASVFLVLLVACANVANLLLDRAANRTREIGIRTALGASRLAIMRQLLVESGILAGVAALVGLALAELGTVLFNRAVAGSSPLFWMDVRLHPAVVTFVIAVAIVASLVSGLAPAIQSSRLDINAILKDESHAASSLRAGRLSRGIVIVEIAASSAILLASGFITRSIVNLRNVDPGFATSGILTARATPTTSDSVQQRRFFEALERDLAAIPGRTGVYVGSGLPGSGWAPRRLTIQGQTYSRERDHPVVRTLAVTPGFFSTFRVPVTRGRAFQSVDRGGAELVAVVSQSFVRRHLRDADPIGKRIRIGSDSTAPWLTIVGVVPTLVAASFDDPWPAEVLTDFWQQRRFDTGAMAIAASTPDATSAATLRAVAAAIDPEIPVYATESMDEVMREPMRFFRIFATLFIVFGIAALTLSSIGLYAVMTFAVSRRVREMGIRIALGATAATVIRMVLRQGASQIAIGMSIGLLAGSSLVRIARATLFQVSPNDPVVIVLVIAVLGGMALLACLMPARRATRVDPVIALRAEC